jgi:hypothetical protein
MKYPVVALAVRILALFEINGFWRGFILMLQRVRI